MIISYHNLSIRTSFNAIHAMYSTENGKNVSPLAVIPLSATHSEILKNILIKYQIYPEIFFVIEGWVGFEWIFKIHFSSWAYVKKFAFLFLVFWIIFKDFFLHFP